MRSHRQLAIRTVAVLVVPLVSACGEGGAEQAAEPGSHVVLPEDDVALHPTVEEHYRIGGSGAEGWEAFSRIRKVAFSGAGLLHILDRTAPGILVVDRTGALERVVGRRGGGPGEFRSPRSFAVAADGSLIVSDAGTRTVALFGPEGDYVANRALDGSQGRIGSFERSGETLFGLPNLAWAGRVGSDMVVPTIPTSEGEHLDPPGLPLLRVPLDGSAASVLRWTWIPDAKGENGRRVETALQPTAHWAVLPDGSVAIADTLDYVVRLIGKGAERVLTRPDLRSRAPSAAERQSEIGSRLAGDTGPGGGGASAGTGPTPEHAMEALREQRRRQLEGSLQFFPELQVIRGLRADHQGNLWIERAGRDIGVPGPIDVIESRGHYLGTVEEGALRLPDAFGPGGMAAWIESDSLDVPVITVGRIALH